MNDDEQDSTAGFAAAHEHEAAASPRTSEQMWGFVDALTDQSRAVRSDAERALQRAAELRRTRDARADIALRACRDALEAYRDAVDHSLRHACGFDPEDDVDAAAAEGSPDRPLGAGQDAATFDFADLAGLAGGTAVGRARQGVARTLATVGMAVVVGLVAWAGLPSWTMSTGGGTPTAANGPAVEIAGADTPDRAASHAAGATSADGVRSIVSATLAHPAEVVVVSEPPQRSEVARTSTLSVPPQPLPDAQTAASVLPELRSLGEAAAGLVEPSEEPEESDGAPEEASSDVHGLLDETVERLDETVDAVRGPARSVGENLRDGLAEGLLGPRAGEGGENDRSRILDGDDDGDDGGDDGGIDPGLGR